MSQVVTIAEAMGTQVVEKKRRESYFNDEETNIIRHVIAKDLNEHEFKMFLYICVRHHLDPLAKQIYAVKRGDQMTIQTGIDGFRLIAERTGKYAPGRATEFAYDESKRLISATAYVKKKVGNDWHEVSATAFMTEYTTNKNTWSKMPHVMLEKCAEARAIRRAFPSDTSGLYTDDEMDQATVVIENIDDSERISKDKCELIQKYLANRPDLKTQVLSFCNIKNIEDMTEKQAEACKKLLEKDKNKNENT